MSVEDDPVVLDADEVLDPAAVPLTDREPVIDRLRPAQRELLFRKHAMGRFRPQDSTVTDGSDIYWRGPKGLDETDIAAMLEVAWLLGLDPFTPGEIWCARSEPRKDGEDAGRLLVMVGRDGRRKIVQRNGLRMRGDVVRENDEFAYWHSDDDGRPLPRVAVVHRVRSAKTEDRGPIVGSWSEVWDPRANATRGFFFAPVEEYDPTHGKEASALSNREKYSPWNHQKTAMMKAACERQSTSEATPLSGLIGEGEAEINREPDRPVLGGDAAPDSRQLASGTVLPGAVWMVMKRATELGHRGLADRAAWEMRTDGQSWPEVTRQVHEAHAELDRMEADSVPDPHGGKAPVDGSLVDVTIQKAPLEDESGPRHDAARSLEEAAELQAAWEAVEGAFGQSLDEARERGDEDAIAEIEEKRDAWRRERDAAADPAQERLV